MKRILILIISLTCLFTAYSKQQTATPFDNLTYNIESYGQDPGASPEEISKRLESLSTEIEMRYSREVQTYIDKYIKTGRKYLSTLIVRSSYYLPIFEQALRNAGLPEELKYLPVIESGLNPKATSPMGAAGLWQFMPIAARGYDMKIGGGIDERRDPYLSSERACKLLKDLYDKFGDWGLAIAAYNAGPGTVQKALKRAGGNAKNHDFWSLRQYLPAETRKYIPHFIAMVYVMNYYEEHNLPAIYIDQDMSTEAIQIYDKKNIRKLATELNVTVEELKAWNPQFTTEVIPATASRPCNVIVPSTTAELYRLKLGNTVPMKEEPVKINSHLVASTEVPAKRGNKALLSDDRYENMTSSSMPNTVIRRPRGNRDTDED